MPEPWDTQREALGTFTRAQRKLATLSLRQLAEMTSLSNPYLSQASAGCISRGVRVLRLISDALNVSAETLLAQLGCWMATDPVPRRGPAGPTGAARTAQPRPGQRRSGYPR